MKLRYALLSLVMLPSLAWAQLPTRAGFPQLDITAPASIAATISNFDDYVNLPRPPYTLPDTTGGLPIIGTSVFHYVDAVSGDSVSMGTYHTPTGVTGEIALALTAGGDPAFGCDGSPELTSDIGNAADLAGKIVLIQRGPVAAGTTACGFFLKAQRLEEAGAIGVIIYNNPERDPDTAINMSGGVATDTPVGIPAAMLPWVLAEPIFTAVANGETVTGTLREDEAYTSAGEGGPSASGAGLFIVGQNPTSTTARLQVRTPAAEAVSVAAYNMLGQRVAVLFEGAVLGQQEVTMTTTGLPAGSYFIRAIGETFTQTQQITVVR
jgi:hypothetical protein